MVDPITVATAAVKFGGVISHICDYKHLKKHDEDLKKHNEELLDHREWVYNAISLQNRTQVKWCLLPQAITLQNKHKETEAYNCLLAAKKLLNLNYQLDTNDQSLVRLIDKHIDELTHSFERRLTQECREVRREGRAAWIAWINKYDHIVHCGEAKRREKRRLQGGGLRGWFFGMFDNVKSTFPCRNAICRECEHDVVPRVARRTLPHLGCNLRLCAPCRDQSCDYEMHFAYHPHCSQDDRDILLRKANITYDWPLQRRAEILAH